MNRCKVCGFFPGLPAYLGGDRLDLLCQTCWNWAGKVLFGWRQAA